MKQEHKYKRANKARGGTHEAKKTTTTMKKLAIYIIIYDRSYGW